MIKAEQLWLLLKNVDENELRINGPMRNASQPDEVIQIFKNYELLLKGEKQEDV